MTGTTPQFSGGVKVIVGGNRTVLVENPSWGEYVMPDIAAQGREKIDHTIFVQNVGYRILDARIDGDTYYEYGEDDAKTLLPRNSSSLLATYADGGGSLQEVPNQRYVSELPGGQNGQTTQGDYRVRKHARTLGGFGSDWAAFPPTPMDEPSPLDRALVSAETLTADDALVFSFHIKGDGSTKLGPLVRLYFPGIAGSKQGDAAPGDGIYSLTFYGNGICLLYERLSNETWTYRQTLRFCSDNMVIGFEHTLRITNDTKRDSIERLYGRLINFEFSNAGLGDRKGSLLDVLSDVAMTAVSAAAMAFQTHTYRIPGATIDNQPTPTKIRVEARRNIAVTFVPVRTFYKATGKVLVKTFTLNDAPDGGVIRIQAFGHFPAGTGTVLRLFGASDGVECTPGTTPVSTAGRKFRNFVPRPGERSYRLVVEMTASSDRLKSPTLERVGWVRQSQFGQILSPEFEVKNISTLSTSPQGTDPSTSSLSFTAWDFLGSQNEFLKKAGQRIRVVADLGPDVSEGAEEGARKKTILFRGILKRPVRKRVAGKGKQGFNGTGPDLRTDNLSRYECKAAGEWAWLAKRIAPGRLDLAFDRSNDETEAGDRKAARVTDVIRDLLISAVGSNRVDVPDIPFPFPLDQDLPQYIEKYQPILPIVVTLVRDYLGGVLWFDENASYPEGDIRGTTDEGMWRVFLAPKKANLRPLVEFCYKPVVSGVIPVDPAAYPDRASEGEASYPIKRTFFRQGTTDEWPEPPLYNQIVVRGFIPSESNLTIGNGYAPTMVLNNWKTAQFNVSGTGPKQGESGGPPSPDFTDPDYTTGDIETLYHSDPMLNKKEAVWLFARRLFDLYCHHKDWHTGEAPLILVGPETTGDPLQINPRPLKIGDIAIIGEREFVLAEGPYILLDGLQGGKRFVHGFYSMHSVPTTDSPRAAYSEMWV